MLARTVHSVLCVFHSKTRFKIEKKSTIYSFLNITRARNGTVECLLEGISRVHRQNKNSHRTLSDESDIVEQKKVFFFFHSLLLFLFVSLLLLKLISLLLYSVVWKTPSGPLPWDNKNNKNKKIIDDYNNRQRRGYAKVAETPVVARSRINRFQWKDDHGQLVLQGSACVSPLRSDNVAP